MKYNLEQIGVPKEVIKSIEIENNLEYEKAIKIEQKFEELEDLISSLSFTSKFGYSLKEEFYDDIEMFYRAREEYDLKRLKIRSLTNS